MASGLDQSQRNLIAVTAACFIGFTGFTLVMPFLPLYFRALGVTDVGEIALWSGLSLGVTPGLTALFTPFWGRVSDRFGRKLLVVRSLAAFVVIMTVLAFVTRPWHVLALRIVLGFFAGYGALALAMAAESAPEGRMASALGTVQTAQRLGPALGPVIGGVLASLVGLRGAFIAAACFYAAGLLLVLTLYREPPRRRSAASRSRLPFRRLLAPGVLLLMVAIFSLQFSDRSLGPILPLYLGDIGVPAARVALVAGVLFSLAAGAGAVGHRACQRALARYPASVVIASGTATSAVAALVFVLRPHPWVVGVATLVFGFAIGIALTAAYTAAGTLFPADARGAGFGLLSSASLVALAVSPIVSGAAAKVSIVTVFVADAVVLTVVSVLVSRVLAGTPVETCAPAVEDA
jgi:DHA1 family multidrug resistance protein-like MFS transporter